MKPSGVTSLVLFIMSPLVAIWAINVLFDMFIPYSIETWLASFVVTSIIHSR